MIALETNFKHRSAMKMKLVTKMKLLKMKDEDEAPPESLSWLKGLQPAPRKN